ncbi:MAG TPA: heavy metal-associated domain-containing protein [Candidatus Limnocylindrales bacterium]|nr:heavy metal-associated domain-containing protein [Candidatus Limnocylindrales bacterium]
MNATSHAGAGPSQSGAGASETIRFPIVGMTCGACVVRVTRALKRLDGIDRVRVDLRDEMAIVRREPSVATDAAVGDAVAAAGYQARLDRRQPADPRDTAGPFGRLLWRH